MTTNSDHLTVSVGQESRSICAGCFRLEVSHRHWSSIRGAAVLSRLSRGRITHAVVGWRLHFLAMWASQHGYLLHQSQQGRSSVCKMKVKILCAGNLITCDHIRPITFVYSFLRIWVSTSLWGRFGAVSYTHLTLPTKTHQCRSRWSPYH